MGQFEPERKGANETFGDTNHYWRIIKSKHYKAKVYCKLINWADAEQGTMSIISQKGWRSNVKNKENTTQNMTEKKYI